LWLLQAGVDLGTALAADEALRRNKRRGKAPSGQVGPQLRPKRRQPISQVLLVGGATRMPAFRRFVQNMTGLRPQDTLVDPDEARFSIFVGSDSHKE
jgi:molecular chaperone DnaK